MIYKQSYNIFVSFYNRVWYTRNLRFFFRIKFIFVSFDNRDWYTRNLSFFFGLSLFISSKFCSNETKLKLSFGLYIHMWNFIFNTNYSCMIFIWERDFSHERDSFQVDIGSSFIGKIIFLLIKTFSTINWNVRVRSRDSELLWTIAN